MIGFNRLIANSSEPTEVIGRNVLGQAFCVAERKTSRCGNDGANVVHEETNPCVGGRFENTRGRLYRRGRRDRPAEHNDKNSISRFILAILVTGCGGFVGSALVRALIERGDSVIGISRRRYPDLESIGMSWERVDLAEPTALDDLIEISGRYAVEGIVHTAAVAGIWGSKAHYFANNFLATKHLASAAINADAKWMVFTSSPSVTFDGSDQSGVDESVGYAQTHLCHYSETKAQAEQYVLSDEVNHHLPVIALRPHLVYGPGDPHLIPRVVERARSGRLRIVGDGNNKIDVTHIENATRAHLAAIETLRQDDVPNEAINRAYFITNNDPVNCWNWIANQIESAGVKPPSKQISAARAYRIGAVLEFLFGLFRIKREPPMTRFVAAQLSTDHYFDISHSINLLGYRPVKVDANGEPIPTDP